MKKWICIIGFILIFVIAIFLGVIIYNNSTKNINSVNNSNENNIVEKVDYSVKNDITIQTTNNNERISPNASLILKKHYNECNHTIKEYAEIPEEFVNLTEEELKEEYKTWKIEKFTPFNVILLKEESGVCGEHYMLREKNGIIAVYKIENNGEEKLIEETGIYTEYLTQNDKTKIREGIKVYGKEELNSTLEDYE